MDMSTKLNLSYPAVQSVPSVPVVADKQAMAPQAVSASAPAANTDSSGSGTGSSDDAEKKSQQLKAAVKQMEQFFQSVRRNLEFSIDDGSGQVVVKVIATETGEVVRQLPSAEALKIADNLHNAHSLLFDAKV